MSPDTNKAIVRRLVEQVWNKRRVDLIEEFFTEDAVLHIAGISSKSRLEDVRDTVNMILNAYPNLYLAIDDEIAEGTKVVNRWTVTGTYPSKMDGISATKAIRSSESQQKHIPIIGLTASVMSDEKQNYLDAGMNAVVEKPIIFEKLMKTIQKTL